MKHKRYIPLHSNCYYHIFNQGNNKENIFYKQENYHYFLKKYDAYMSNYLETYAYCLLPDHFHILARVKNILLPLKTGTKIYKEATQIVSEAFRRFFTSYSKSINKQEDRNGSLFQKNFRRREVDNEAYFSYLIYYIHTNPLRHKIFNNFEEYPYSSYSRMLIDKPSKLQKQEVMNWFGSKDAFIKFHKSQQDCKSIKHLMIEDRDKD